MVSLKEEKAGRKMYVGGRGGERRIPTEQANNSETRSSKLMVMMFRHWSKSKWTKVRSKGTTRESRATMSEAKDDATTNWWVWRSEQR